MSKGTYFAYFQVNSGFLSLVLSGKKKGERLIGDVRTYEVMYVRVLTYVGRTEDISPKLSRKLDKIQFSDRSAMLRALIQCIYG